ncbi:MAG: porin [Rubellimicrobium sp.]|nr:porin [Rubellimicrobium sp.]
MKHILLASVSAFAFAGAAAAEVTFSGSAELGYNDTAYVDADDTDNNYGFYWSADVALTMSKALNNGLTASASVGIDLASTGNLGLDDLDAYDYVLSLTSETAGLYFGTTDTAANKHYSGVSGMENDGFTSGTDSPVLRGDITYGGVNASVSYLVNGADLEQLSVGASGAFGNFNFTAGYQAESAFADGNDDYNANGIFGVSVGTTFAGADVKVAYAMDTTLDESSIGISGSYPVGPVTVGAYYAMQDNGDGNAYGVSATYASGPISATVYYDDSEFGDSDWGIDGSYAVGNGLTVLAGMVSSGDDYYVAGTFDLGENAVLGVSYAVDDDHSTEDAIGAPEYQEGATAWVSFTF